jgi:hypothetical protein
MLVFLGLPLDTFGKVRSLPLTRLEIFDKKEQDAFFQPYLPLQQIDLLRQTKSWLAGSTNSIVTQQREIDLLVDVSLETYHSCIRTAAATDVFNDAD